MARGVGGQSPANVAEHLKGVDFPADRNALLERARSHGADQAVLDVLRSMPEGEYGSMAEVMKGVGAGRVAAAQASGPRGASARA